MDHKAGGADQQADGSRKAIGDYISSIADVPKEVRDYAVKKLTPVGGDGRPMKDAKGKEITAIASTAKENGSYYGPVVLNNDKFLVQAVGKDRLYAIVHRKDDLTLKGNTLALLDAKKQLNGTSVQIHYSGDTGQAYPYADKTKQRDATPAKAIPEFEVLKPESFMELASEYAKVHIKNKNQREAFLKHLGAVSEKAFQQRFDASRTPQSTSTRGPTNEHIIER